MVFVLLALLLAVNSWYTVLLTCTNRAVNNLQDWGEDEILERVSVSVSFMVSFYIKYHIHLGYSVSFFNLKTMFLLFLLRCQGNVYCICCSEIIFYTVLTASSSWDYKLMQCLPPFHIIFLPNHTPI